MADNAEKALDVANQIAAAVVKKFPGFTQYTRRYELGENDPGFVEIVLKPAQGGKAQEVATAYSDDFFASATKENISDKAKRVLHDLRIHMGVKV